MKLFKLFLYLFFGFTVCYLITGITFCLLTGKGIVLFFQKFYLALPFDIVLSQSPKSTTSFVVGVWAAIISSLVIKIGFSKSKSSSLHGDARFASDSEIKNAGLMSDTTGLIVGKYKDKLLRFPGNQFIALQAPTRSGKGVGIVIPNLLDWKFSAVILDIKQECFDITSKYRAEYLGNKVFLFNPFSQETHRYNPLGYVDFDSELADIEVSNIAMMLYPVSGKDKFWNQQAQNLFSGIVFLLNDLIKNDLTDLTMDLSSVLKLKDGQNGVDLIGYFDSLIELEKENDIQILSEKTKEKITKYINIKSENTMGNIQACFDAPLLIFGNDVVANATSANDFDLRMVRKEKITIYLGITPDNLLICPLLVNLFFSQLILLNTKTLPSKDPEIKHQCLVLMDELTSIGCLDVLLSGCAFVAGFWLRLMLIFQSKAQLEEEKPSGYGRTGATTLLDNCACTIMYTPKPKDAKEYSEALGYQTVKNKSSSTNKGGGGGGSFSESDTKRALMLPQELSEMSSKEQILKIDTVKPIKCHKAFYYNDPYLLDCLKKVSPTIAAHQGTVPESVFMKAFMNGETKINLNIK